MKADRRPTATTRYAGRVGEHEYGVTTVEKEATGGRDYCLRPCSQCPWRTDSPTGAFPAEAYRHSANTAHDMSTHSFGCHMTSIDQPKTCAGFLLRGADHNMAVRIGRLMGRIGDDVTDAGLPLYDSYRAMAEANGVAPGDPALRDCR